MNAGRSAQTTHLHLPAVAGLGGGEITPERIRGTHPRRHLLLPRAVAGVLLLLGLWARVGAGRWSLDHRRYPVRG